MPHPFSLTTYVTSAPLHVPAGLDDAELEAYRRAVEVQLHDVTEDAQRWAEGRPRLPRQHRLVISQFGGIETPGSDTDPDGIRTRVAALKGPCPRPLDDGATPRGRGR